MWKGFVITSQWQFSLFWLRKKDLPTDWQNKSTHTVPCKANSLPNPETAEVQIQPCTLLTSVVYLYPHSFVSPWNNFYVLPWLCRALCWQGPECTSRFCNLLPLSCRFGCLCSRSVMIQWNVIWDQSAVRRAVCQRAGRSRLGPPQFRWEPWYRASLVFSPHLGWTVRVFVPDCGHGWSWLDFLAHPRGLTDLLAMCGHCHQTCSALLAWSMCLCALLPEVPAVLTASPAHLCSSGSPSSSAAPQAPLPSSWHGPQHHRVSETPGEDGQWYERHYCYDNKADVAFLCLPSSTWEAKAKFRPLGASRDAGRAAGRRSSLDTALDPSQALAAACFKGIALDLPSWDFLAHKPPAADDRGNFVVLQPSGPRDLFKTFSRLFSACFSHYDVFNCHYVRYLRYSGRCWGCLLVPRNGQVLYFPRKLV